MSLQFDLDALGAECTEEPRAAGGREEPREVDNAYAAKGKGVRHN